MGRGFGLGSLIAGGVALSGSAVGQVPDLLNALDAGGRSMGMGGSLNATDSNTLSSYYNPAGLGFLDSRVIGATYRNLPTSTTFISNSRTDPHYDSQGSSGSRNLTHLGYATPVRQLFGKGEGVLAFSYTVGGFVDDKGFGPGSGLPDGPLIIKNYQLHRMARADFYTLAYGRSTPSQNVSYGLGLTYAQQRVVFVESGNATDASGNPVPFPGSNVDFTAHGVGALVGVQVVPKDTPNMSIGASFRSEIHLSGADPGGIYDNIPARFLLGLSYRKDDLRGGQDYAVFGAQIQHFFATGSSIAFDRGGQNDIGFGLEYNHAISAGTIPLRLGYDAVGSGGTGFGPRNAFTYGLGFRPARGSYGIDLDWASPQGGGFDFGISASYRFK